MLANREPKYAAPVRVFVIGAGQVGSTIVEALHDEHEITVLDTEASRLQAFASRYDVAVFEGDGTSRKDLAAAGVEGADLVIACTSRDEVNLVAGMFAREPPLDFDLTGRREPGERLELVAKVGLAEEACAAGEVAPADRSGGVDREQGGGEAVGAGQPLRRDALTPDRGALTQPLHSRIGAMSGCPHQRLGSQLSLVERVPPTVALRWN